MSELTTRDETWSPGGNWQYLDRRSSDGQFAGTKALQRFLTLQLFSLIYLQKFAVKVPGIPELSAPLLIMLASLIYMILKRQLEISPIRAGIYTLFVAAAVFSHVMVQGMYSVPSFFLLLIYSGLLVVSWEVEWAFFENMLKKFLNLMIFPAVMVIVDLLTQVTLGMGNLPNLERLVPKFLLLPGYLYDAPYEFGASFVRPNGFFMLEPSYISAFLGAAIAIEVMYFRRPRWLLLFFTALIGCTAVTGMVLLACAAPFLLARQSRRFRIITVTTCGIALLIASPLGLVDRLGSRVGELDASGSSGAERVVVPAEQLAAVFGQPEYLVSGEGAGQLDEASGSAWPALKLAKEYGLLTMTFYMALFVVGLSRPENRPLKIGLFVVFHLTGGYLLNPIMFEIVVLLCTMVTPSSIPDAPVQSRPRPMNAGAKSRRDRLRPMEPQTIANEAKRI